MELKVDGKLGLKVDGKVVGAMDGFVRLSRLSSSAVSNWN